MCYVDHPVRITAAAAAVTFFTQIVRIKQSNNVALISVSDECLIEINKVVAGAFRLGAEILIDVELSACAAAIVGPERVSLRSVVVRGHGDRCSSRYMAIFKSSNSAEAFRRWKWSEEAAAAAATVSWLRRPSSLPPPPPHLTAAAAAVAAYHQSWRSASARDLGRISARTL